MLALLRNHGLEPDSLARRGAPGAVAVMTATRTAAYRSLFDLDAGSYQPHAVHGSDRTYAESNCYTDIIIELLHGRGDEPLAALGCLVRTDFEGDQWTFFKPPPEDLEDLFGIDIHEMQPYRPLPLQIAEQIDAGRTIIVELDSWFLPDTAATSYRSEHVKTSVAAEAIDLERGWMRYFHGPGLYELDGEDYAGIFRLDGDACPGDPASLHRDRPLRRRAAAARAPTCARPPARRCAATWRTVRRATRSSASASS